MKNKLLNFKRQVENGKCGIYNLANALRIEDFLMYEDESDYVPTGYHEISKILRVNDGIYKPVPVIDSFNWKNKIPKGYFKNVINSFAQSIDDEMYDTPMFIFILGVQTGKTEFGLHAITLYVTANSFAYSDPQDYEFTRINSLDLLFERYNYINSVESFEWTAESGTKGYVIFDQQALKAYHLLNHNIPIALKKLKRAVAI